MKEENYLSDLIYIASACKQHVSEIREMRWTLMNAHLEAVTSISNNERVLTTEEIEIVKSLSEDIFQYQAELTRVANELEKSKIVQGAKLRESCGVS